MSKIHQKIISFQGASGANSDLACRAMFPDWQTLPCETFQAAFDAVQDGRADAAMIPVDNTLAGRVADVHHLLPDSGLSIIGEHFEPIHHALMGVKGAKLSDLKYAHSHIHAIPQCRKIIQELKLIPQVGADTAGSARAVAERNDPAHAAIANPLAAKIYGLEILRDHVEDEDHNTTRFIVLSKDKIIPQKKEGDVYLTSIIFRVRNIPAALYKALGGFATNGVNMLKLESYINPEFQVAQFYADVEGHQDDHNIRLALEELRFFASEFTLLGCYPAHAFRKGL
ncbi:MAG: prephenate dehydratase [Rhodospirillales bacterium]|nr:prephenate dehydratase [Rhodospirillales bacterium]MCB9973683.1 prephenate dehydratase [Rhodospirillales bacterium]